MLYRFRDELGATAEFESDVIIPQGHGEMTKPAAAYVYRNDGGNSADFESAVVIPLGLGFLFQVPQPMGGGGPGEEPL
jgi:hypothetical protein